MKGTRYGAKRRTISFKAAYTLYLSKCKSVVYIYVLEVSYREVPLGELTSITLGPPSLEQEKLERTATVREKFNRLKYYLVMMLLYDKMELPDAASKFSQRFRVSSRISSLKLE